MSNRRSKVAFAATSVVLTIAVAACGSSSSSPSAAKTSGGVAPTTAGGDQGNVAAAFNASTKGVVNASTAKGGTLNLLATADFDSMDPTRTYYAYSWDFQRFFTRSLMGFDAKPGEDGTKAVPDLATGKGVVTNGGKTITYTLKDGVKFQDGTPVTSKDIKYGVERNFAQDVLPGGPTYLHDMLDEGQNYPGPYKDTDPNKLGLKSVQTPDAKTIVFNLSAPYSDWDYIMTLPSAAPVEEKFDQDPSTGGAKYANHVQATGPYEIQSYEPNKSVVLVPNPNWDASTDTIHHQLVNKIVLTEGLDSDDMDKRLLSGQGDIEIESTGVQSAAQTQILRDPNLKKSADAPLTGFTRMFALDPNVPELSNVDCRKAIEYAANKVDLQTARGGPIGGGDIATTVAPPTLPGYQSFNDYPSGADNTGDLTQAKAELAKCGKPTGFHTNIATTNKGKGPKVAQALQAALARVGIQADIQQFDSSTYYSTVIGTPSNVHKKDLGIMVAGWGADFPTGFGFFSAIADGRKILQAGGNSNWPEVNDPAVNAALDDMTATTDAAQKAKDVQTIDHALMDGAYYLPFTYDKALTYHNPRVTNVYITNAFGMYDFDSMGVNDGK
ncbi:ABC transporter substrate-binding protein [Catenulispora rubra]|uniref:ABC transporter substrate-binding protein n=1 Tax=Catenulispora rubra TaxID=280293 RepID=UPI001891F72D|nr:ABC transporter substrate-binding protein [Catenulispora rubra]